MAEQLQPHHHVLRRAEGPLFKYLDLTDETLIDRLIDRGCISEHDRGQYSGRSKRPRDLLIARLRYQPFEVFLAFVECLRDDGKYAQLVKALDEALDDYGCHASVEQCAPANSSAVIKTSRRSTDGEYNEAQVSIG